jgi:TRAP-type C4-dicarboxylate transport system substrate-binding protein
MTTSTKPLRRFEDFAGLRVRVIAAPIFVDLFKALGAAPVPLDANELYTSLQTHLVDAQEGPLISIEGFKIYEVQKYMSLTNHIWGGEWIAMNGDAWKALPADLQSILERNVESYVRAERRLTAAFDRSLADKLARQGLAVNAVDVASIRRQLGGYYARWKNEFGAEAWGLLEAKVGKLV